MNLNQLKIFHTVARVLNFTRAAEELHLTQPGITKHVKALEEYYGTPLFDRLGKRIALTQAGEVLYAATREIFALLDETKSRMDDLESLAGGALRIGASATIATYVLPGLLTRFRQSAPFVEIRVETAFSGRVVESVLDNRLELGLVSHCRPDARLAVHTFLHESIKLVVAPDHPWAELRTTVALPDLSRETFLLSKEGSGTWRAVSAALKQCGIVLTNTMELGTTEALKQATAAGLGVTLLSGHVVAGEVATGALVDIPLDGEGLHRDLFLVYHKDRHLSKAARAFIALLDL